MRVRYQGGVCCGSRRRMPRKGKAGEKGDGGRTEEGGRRREGEGREGEQRALSLPRSPSTTEHITPLSLSHLAEEERVEASVAGEPVGVGRGDGGGGARERDNQQGDG